MRSATRSESACESNESREGRREEKMRKNRKEEKRGESFLLLMVMGETWDILAVGLGAWGKRSNGFYERERERSHGVVDS